MIRAIQSFRKLPFLASLVVVVVAAASFRVVYVRQRTYIEARNARLLAMPERTLIRIFQADGGALERTLWREGGELKVGLARAPSSGRPAAQPAPEPITIRLDELLRAVPLGTEAFDLLLVADDEGHVIDQVGDETLSRQSLAGLRRADGKPLEAAELWNAAQLVDARFNGREVALFCRPVVLPHEVRGPGAARDDRRGFLFCGIASAERMRDAALCISPLLVAALAGVVVLTLLTPPFIKPFVLGRRERLRFGDVYALALSAFLGLMLVTVVVLDMGAFAALRRSADDVLEAVATRARDHLREELERAQSQLRALDQAAARGGGSDRCTNAYGLMGEPPVGCPPLPLGDIDYPYFESVAWAGPDGQQLRRWRTDRRELPLRSVAGREYFKAVREDRLWRPRDAGADGPAAAYFIQALRTFWKGETRAVVSIRAAAVPNVLMASLTTSLLSVSKPVLPPRVGLAVIDPEGEVLFHSEPTQSLTHNLFAETGENADLRAAVAARGSHLVAGRYWGRSHRFFTAPLPDTPWTVVAFRREDLLRGVNVQVLESTIGLVLLYTVGAFALPSLLYVAVAHKRVGWLVPGGTRGPVYAELAVTLFLAFALLWLRLRSADSADAVWLGFAAPLAVLALAAAAFRLRLLERLGALLGRERRRRFVSFLSSRYRVSYVVASLLFWALYAVLPVVAFTKASVQRELQALAQLEDLQQKRALASRERGAESFYGQSLTRVLPAAAAGRPTPDERLLRKRLDERLDLYQARLWSTGPVATMGAAETCWGTAALPPCDGWLCDTLEGERIALPNLDPASVELRYLPPLRVQCGDAASRGADAGPVAGSLRPDIAERVGPWPAFWTLLGPWPFVVLALLAAPAVAWIRWCARHLFRADVVRPQPRTPEDLRQGFVANAFCVAPSSLELDRLLEGGWCRRLALRERCDQPETCIDASRPLVVDLRGFLEVEVARREAVLECVEALARSGRQPLYLAATSSPAGLLDTPTAAVPLPAGELQRWLRLFDRLQVVFLRSGHGGSEAEADSREQQSARRLLGRSAGALRTAELVEELRAVPRLRWLADHHLASGAFDGVARCEMLRRLAELADSEYRALWSASTPDEKLSLVHVCDEHFLNPRQVSAVSRLLDRGLLVRDPALRPVSQSFALYVRESGVREEVEPLEKPGEGLAWGDLQLPALTLAAVCGIVLFISHQDLLETSVPLVSILSATGVPMLVKVASVFKDLAANFSGGHNEA